MASIKVLFVSPFTSGGGACRNMFNIIRQLDDNYDTRLIVTGDEGLPTEYEGLIETISLGSASVSGAFSSLYRQIKAFRPNYIFATTMNTGLVCALIVKLGRLRCTCVARCTVTPSEIYHHSLKNRLLRWALQMGGRMIDVVIAQTDYMRNDLVSFYRLPPAKVRTIRNIVDIDHVRAQATLEGASELSSDSYNILGVGALYSVKGFDILIDAIAPIIQANPKVNLYILGEERYEVGYQLTLQQQIEKLHLSDNIHLLGKRSNPFPYFKKANLFVLSSRKEGYPNVVLESLALGTPVVATDVVDFKDVISSGINGYIVQKDSVESLRDGIQKAMAIDKSRSQNKPLTNFDFKQLFS